MILAIYSTLGPAQTLAEWLRAQNMLRVSFAVFLAVVVLAVVWQWVRKRPGWREVGVAFGVALAYAAVLVRMDTPEERTHLIEYGIVAALIHQAFLERTRNGRPVPNPAGLTVAATALLGLVDECIQLLLPSRFFDWRDVFFNALAGFMVIAARLALMPVRRPGWRLWFLWMMSGAIGWGWSMDAGSFGEGRPLLILESLPALTVPPFMGLATGGIVVGLFHWLLLRRYVTGSLLWIPATVGAVALSGLVILLAGQFDADSGQFLGTALFGLLAGVLQWLVLRRQFSRSGWWIPACTVAWLVALPFGDMMGPPGWALYGFVTGAVMVWVLRGDSGTVPLISSGGID